MMNVLLHVAFLSSGGRSSGGGGMFGRSSAPKASASPTRSAWGAPKPATAPKAAAGGMGGMGSGLMGTMATGMAFGAGSEIAHQGVKAMMGSGSSGSGDNQGQQGDNGQQQ